MSISSFRIFCKHSNKLFCTLSFFRLLLFSHSKGICQYDTLKLRVFISTKQIVECFLNIDCGDIVRQQHYLISVYLIGVLVKQIINVDKTAAEQTNNECTRTREWIEDMNALIIERAVKLIPQNIVHALDDEVNDLNRRIDDTELCDLFRQSVLEELLIKLYDDLLLSLSVINALSTFLNAQIELVECFLLLVERLFVKDSKHILHNTRYGIALDKLIVLKESIENRFCDHVLGKHFDSIGGLDRRIEVLL